MNDNKEYIIGIEFNGKLIEFIIKPYWRIRNIFNKQDFIEDMK